MNGIRPPSNQKNSSQNLSAYLPYATIILILIVILFSACQMAQFHRHPSEIIYPPLDFVPPKPERMVLPNGMVLYLMEDHEVPLVTVHTLIRTGSIYEPADKVGLARITGEVMRTGGTRNMDAEELNRKLEFMGAILETGIGTESASATLSVMTKDLDEGLGIFSEVLRYPAFAQDKVDLSKMKMIESIRRQNDDPLNIASREFKRKVYHGDPRGRIKTIEGVQRITRQDLIEFHQSAFFPDNIIMGISGDFEKDQILKKINTFFGAWEMLSRSVSAAPIPESRYERSVVYAERPLPQSTIILGHLCVPKNHPDYFPMEILNNILGEGFNSRLMREIRSNRGLAYSVGSFYRGDIDYGVFGAYAMTKSETTAMVIDLIFHELRKMIENDLKDHEMNWAKDSIINQYVFSFASTDGLVKRYMSLEYDRLPEDFIEKYTGMIFAVTLEDIRRVARQYLKPDQSILVVVGNGLDFDRSLGDYGEVERADLTIR